MITGIGKVIVPVDDQDRAVDFWTDRIGFRLVRDEKYGDERRIEVAPANRSVVLVLSQRTPNQPRPAVPPDLPHSTVFFACDDIVYTYQVLAERGVRFPVSPMQNRFGWWAMFEDDDGTRYGLGQW